MTVADARQGAASPPAPTLFVYARPADGSRMPLAIVREPAGNFPVQFKLDDSLAMAPQVKLSLQQRGDAGRARSPRAATPRRSRGDLTGSLGPVKVGAARPQAGASTRVM